MAVKTNLSSIETSKKGNLNSKSSSFEINPDEPSIDKLEGYFDKHAGKVVLDFGSIGVLEIENLPTKHSLGRGKKGERGNQGKQGNQGKVGLSGLTGNQGKRGEAGKEGKEGRVGERGDKGDKGEKGLQGEKGINGTNVEIPFFIQKEDPNAVGAGAIWVKRLDGIEREDINVFAPRVIVDDVTIRTNEVRDLKVRMIKNDAIINRYEVSIEKEARDYITVETAWSEINEDFTIRITNIKPPELENPDDLFSSKINIFLDSDKGSAKAESALTILPETFEE